MPIKRNRRLYIRCKTIHRLHPFKNLSKEKARHAVLFNLQIQNDLHFAVQQIVGGYAENFAQRAQTRNTRLCPALFPVCIATFDNAQMYRHLLLCHSRLLAHGFQIVAESFIHIKYYVAKLDKVSLYWIKYLVKYYLSIRFVVRLVLCVFKVLRSYYGKFTCENRIIDCNRNGQRIRRRISRQRNRIYVLYHF